MDLMSPRVATLILLTVWALSGAAFAQGEEDEASRIRAAQQEAQRQAAQERRAAEEDRQRREAGIKALNDFMNDSRTQIASAVNAAEARQARERAIQLEQFRGALTVFRTATGQLSEALGSKAKLKDPARQISKSTAVFLDFIKRTSKEPSRFDPSEFKDFTRTELGWEALTSAERLVPHLAAVMLTESEATVDIRFLASLSKIQAELLRLQWMTQRLK